MLAPFVQDLLIACTALLLAAWANDIDRPLDGSRSPCRLDCRTRGLGATAAGLIAMTLRLVGPVE